MKFKCSVTINSPLDKVVELFINPKNLKEYQDGFIKKELISGVAGQADAISKMYYKQGRGTMELTETIIANNLPEEFFSKYHHKHMDNTMRCNFTALGNNETRYDSELEYTAFRGILPRIMAYLFPGIFKKQVQKWLNNFKTFAEKSN
ncbi:MAG: putative membrane protein [Saprospiraceae bacterium]|jgi:uncharacterized membrane protein